jgi:hypothetical protein
MPTNPYTGKRFDVVSDWPIKVGCHNGSPLKRPEAERLAARVRQDAAAWGCAEPNVRIVPSKEWERWKQLASGRASR